MQETILLREDEASSDPVEGTLRSISQNIIVLVFGLLPLFFIPVSYVPFDYAKTLFVIFGVLLAIIFFSLSVLRSGKIQFAAPLALCGLWIVVVATSVSAMLSGDMRDAFLGDNMGIHTGVFVLLLALVATVGALIGQTKVTIMRLYILLTGSAIVLGIFHIARFVFGPDLLSFSLFNGLINTPIGGWNDLALFFGLSILLSLVALEQLPLTKWGRSLFSAVIALALIVLAVVNFFAVWLVLGLVSLVMLMYSLSKDRFSEKTLTLEGKKNAISIQSVLISFIVFAVSAAFIIGGGALGGYINKVTGISYIEVRPSFEATTDIARHVYKENAFVGIGPNKFIDAWRLYKDPSINQTVFWSTDFEGASGYLTTLFVTTGIFGMLAWLLFLGLFLFSGFKMLFRSVHVDRFWYFIGSSSFVAALYLWTMSFVYVPGATILLLTAVFTSISFAAYAALIPTRTLAFSISSNKRAGFALIGVVMLVIVTTTIALYYAGKHFTAVNTFSDAVYGLQNGMDIKQAEEKIASAFSSSRNEKYAIQLASYQLSKINVLAGIPKLTDAQQQELQVSVQNAISAAQIAVEQDPTDARNWATYGSVLSVLAGASVEGAQDKAREAFAKARSYDPSNPLYVLLEAQLDSRVKDLESARSSALKAVELKSNYTDALFFLTQLDIAEGKTDDAIATTQAIISLEPNNPARYYQLGVLLSSSNKLDAAIDALKQAIALDTNYANARYFLALALAQKGDTNAAVEQLQKVLELNPGNADVTALIEQIRSGKPFEAAQNTTSQQVAEPQTVTTDADAVTTTEVPDTSLITPVNTVGDADDESSNTESNEEEVTQEQPQ